MGLELQIQQKLSPIRDPIRAFLKSGLKAAPKIRRIYSKIHIYALNLFRLSASHFLCACLGQDKISTFSLFVSPPHPAPVFQQFYSCFMTQGLGGGGVQQGLLCALFEHNGKFYLPFKFGSFSAIHGTQWKGVSIRQQARYWKASGSFQSPLLPRKTSSQEYPMESTVAFWAGLWPILFIS